MSLKFNIRTEINTKGKAVHYAQLAGSTEPEFKIGTTVSYKKRIGLANDHSNPSLKYKPQEYVDEFGFWAYFIAPTAQVECSGSFIAINTYDRAYFTFGFMQFAAHVHNGDFVDYLKHLLALPNAKDYFPKLVLQKGRIFYKSDSGVLSQLENDKSSTRLMEYLNPTTDEVEQQELICAARMIHWATHDSNNRKIQVTDSIALFKRKMKEANNRLKLNGFPANVCLVVCDILHNGRSNYATIANALDTGGDYNEAFERICAIGVDGHSRRLKLLRSEVATLIKQGVFNKRYNASLNEFK